MRSPIRILIFAILLVPTLMLFHQARVASASTEVDAGKVIALFGGVVILGVVIAILFVTTIMPMIAEAAGNLFFNPSEQIEKDPHSDAISAVARGDFEGAVEAYKAICENDPGDTLALSEMAKIYCEHLENAPAAAETLEEALKREWPPDGAAFLSMRLVDVYWKFQHNAIGSRGILLQIIETMPETRHSANAMHRLQEIDKELALEG